MTQQIKQKRQQRCCFNDHLDRVVSSAPGNEREHEALEKKIQYLKMVNVQIRWWKRKVGDVEINNIDCFIGVLAA